MYNRLQNYAPHEYIAIITTQDTKNLNRNFQKENMIFFQRQKQPEL